MVFSRSTKWLRSRRTISATGLFGRTFYSWSRRFRRSWGCAEHSRSSGASDRGETPDQPEEHLVGKPQTMPTIRTRRGLIPVVVITACLGDPVGPGSLTVATDGASVDTVWLGAPGEMLPNLVRLRVTDDAGRPLPAARLTWEAVGRNAQVLDAAEQSNSAGFATARWQLGSDAAEEQRLHVLVRIAGQQSEVVIRARAVPDIVSQIRVLVDTPAVLRLGDTLPVGVNAIDPYGNVFTAPDVVLSVGDSAIGWVVGQSLVGGPRRGQALVRVASHGVEAVFPLRVTQYVAAVVPLADTLRFSALGAQRPVTYLVRDDRGRVVADTTVAISVTDTAVAQLLAEYVRALAPGVTAIRLTLGSAAATIIVDVQQRVGSLRLVRDTIRLDALMDTTTVVSIVHDSLGSPILEPALEYVVSDAKIVKFATDRILKALRPGSAVVTVRDTATGISTSVPVVVRQVVAKIDVTPPQILFDALGDTLTVDAVGRDRLGSVVAGAALDFSIADARVAALQSGLLLRSVAPGQTMVVVGDPETGIVATAELRVEQRAANLQLTVDTVSFDALGDTIRLAFSARDRLDAPISSTPVSYSSTDTAVVTVGADGLVRSRDNGGAFVIARSPDGPADSVQVSIAQRVEGISVDRDSVLFESLQAVQPVRVTATDRLGATVRSATVSYTTADADVAAVDTLGHMCAVGNGTTRVVASAGGHTVTTQVRVSQRAVRVSVTADTILFAALGDMQSVTGVALDSLGSPVAGNVANIVALDTAVVEVDLADVYARGNGITSVSLSVAGVTGRVVVVVDQIATGLTVRSTFGNSIVSLPVGTPFPVACAAIDRNSNPVLRDPTLASTVKGTVTGSGCADARVARSGYDTLVFTLGSAQARLPVIIATAPDSVGVVTAAQPLTDDPNIRYVGEDLGKSSTLALRPLVEEILSAYGNPTSNLSRARAIRDWVARTALYSQSVIHADNSTSNLSVLPTGKTWADVNALLSLEEWERDTAYWSDIGGDGYTILNRLLGTLDPATGLRADDGIMVHVTGAHYQMRDIESYRFFLCSYQTVVMNTLWAAAGLHGMLLWTYAHDPAAVFIPEVGRWVFEDPSYNNDYLLDGIGDPLSPIDLLALSTNGMAGRARPSRILGPSYDPEVFIQDWAYLEAIPNGMVFMGALIFKYDLTTPWSGRFVQIDVPELENHYPANDQTLYPRVSAEQAFPTLGVVVGDVRLDDSVFVARLTSNYPNHQRF